MVTKDIDVNGHVFRVSAGVTARSTVDAIRDFYGLQGGEIVENGTRNVSPHELLGDLTGALYFHQYFAGGQPVGTNVLNESLDSCH